MNKSLNPYPTGENRRGVLPISWDRFHSLCKGLARAVARFEPELILPIGRGGYYPGTLLAHMLRVELQPVRLSRRIHDIVQFDSPRWYLRPSAAAVVARRVLVVDEISSSGETIALVKQAALERGAVEVRSAVLYAHTSGAETPDYIGLISDALILNPWDREIFEDGAFVWHPEYTSAMTDQGLTPDQAWLITSEITQLAKGEPIHSDDE